MRAARREIRPSEKIAKVIVSRQSNQQSTTNNNSSRIHSHRSHKLPEWHIPASGNGGGDMSNLNEDDASCGMASGQTPLLTSRSLRERKKERERKKARQDRRERYVSNYNRRNADIVLRAVRRPPTSVIYMSPCQFPNLSRSFFHVANWHVVTLSRTGTGLFPEQGCYKRALRFVLNNGLDTTREAERKVIRKEW